MHRGGGRGRRGWAVAVGTRHGWGRGAAYYSDLCLLPLFDLRFAHLAEIVTTVGERYFRLLALAAFVFAAFALADGGSSSFLRNGLLSEMEFGRLKH